MLNCKQLQRFGTPNKAWENVFFFEGWSSNLKCGAKPEVSLFVPIFFGQQIYTLPKTYMEPEKMLAFEKEYLSSRWPLSGSLLVFRTGCEMVPLVVVVHSFRLWWVFFRRVPTKIRCCGDQSLKPGINR